MTQCVLVTGGAGYIGSHVCKVLAQAGLTPVTIDNLVYGHRTAVNWGPLEICDLTDAAELTRMLTRYDPVAAMHFAAYAYVGESVIDPEKYYYNNVVGSLSLLRCLRKKGIDKLVFSSSCATYGIPDVVPISESHAQLPVNPYGRSKLMVEHILRDFAAAHEFRYVSLRYFNAAGADPGGEIGENHDPETHLIPSAIEAALGKRPYLDIFGTDYPTPDGTAIRDYIDVTDLAVAHVAALNYLFDGGIAIALNLGTGTGHSVREVIASVERVSTRTVPVREAPRRPGDPPVLVADPSKARKVLGWNPKITDLDGIVRTAWTWHTRGGSLDSVQATRSSC